MEPELWASEGEGYFVLIIAWTIYEPYVENLSAKRSASLSASYIIKIERHTSITITTASELQRVCRLLIWSPVKHM